MVIILFAALAFVTGYSVVERKVNKCNCPDCKLSGNANVVNDGSIITNSDGSTTEQKKVYTYNDLAGHYKAEFIVEDDRDFPNKLELYLYNDATYYYTYTSHFFAGSIGTYTIDGNNIILNNLFFHGSDIATTTMYDKNIVTFNDNYEITFNFLPTAFNVRNDDIIFSKVESYNDSNNENSLVKKRLNETQLYNEYMKNN